MSSEIFDKFFSFFLNAQAKPWTKAGSVKTEKALSEPLTVSFFRGWHLISFD